MRTDPLSPLAMAYAAFRLLAVAGGLLAAWRLYRRPDPRGTVLLAVALSLVTWAATVAPLGRLYGLEEHLDVAFNVGTAACVAAGNSPWHHMQAGFGNLEPFFSVLLAALALFRPERVMGVFFWMPAVAIVAVSVALYLGLRDEDGPDDAAERALMVFAVLALASFSLSQRPPLPLHWPASFLHKPNHALSWAFVGLAAGAWLRGARAVSLGLALGLLAWSFILTWAYFVAGLAAAALLARPWRPALRRLAGAVALALALSAPYVLHLARDYGPAAGGTIKHQVWADSTGLRIAAPHWATLDLGILLVLGVLGTAFALRRRSRRDVLLVGMVGAAWLLWAAYQAGLAFGVSPEADEHHYYLRLVMALAAGRAMAEGGRLLESARGLASGQGHALVLAAALPLGFTAYWDPPSMDRYFKWCLEPLRPNVLAYGEWVRRNTPPDALFVAGRSASIWIPVLAGRRVLLTDDSRPPRDFDERRRAERDIVLSRSPERILAAARRYGVTHLAVDHAMIEAYGEERLAGIARLPAFELVYRSPAIRILRIRGPDGR